MLFRSVKTHSIGPCSISLLARIASSMAQPIPSSAPRVDEAGSRVHINNASVPAPYIKLDGVQRVIGVHGPLPGNLHTLRIQMMPVLRDA